MTTSRWLPGLRGRFLLVVLLAVVLPLAITTALLGRSLQRASVAAVEQRLDRQLVATANEVGQGWVVVRSGLLDLAEDSLTRAAVAGDTAAAERWRRTRGTVPPPATRVTLVGTTGHTVAALRAPGPAAAGSLLETSFPVHDANGRRVGTMRAAFPRGALIPDHFGFGGAAVPAVLAPDDGALRGAPEGVRFDVPAFRWQGESWITRRYQLHEPPLILALAAPVAPPESFVAAAQRGLLVLLLVMLGTLALASLLTRRVTASLERLSATAGEVARGRFGAAVPEEGPPEVRRLARAFNAMAESLQGLVRRLGQQEAAAAVGQFAATLAHEVRNPVTAVRLDLERALDRLSGGHHPEDLLRRALEQVDRLDATVEGTLRIARSGNLRLQPVDLRGPVAAALRSAVPAFAERGLPPPEWAAAQRAVPVLGHPGALEQLLLNLLLNAADASAAAVTSAPVSVEVRAGHDGVELRVTDAGVGMSADQVERAFQPFFTTTPGGTGLGLTMVRRMAEAHGAELHVDSRPGAGTTVRVAFPPPDPGQAVADVQGVRDADRSDLQAARSVTARAPAGAPGQR